MKTSRLLGRQLDQSIDEDLPLGLFLQVGSRLIDAGARQAFADLPLRPEVVLTLFVLDLVPGLRQVDYAEMMRLDVSTFGRYLDRLEQDGYVARTRSDADRRAVTLELTEAGREVVTEARRRTKEREALVAERIGADEFDRLRDELARLVEVLFTVRLAAEGKTHHGPGTD